VKLAAATVLLAGASIAAVVWYGTNDARAPELCPAGLLRLGPRCCGEGQSLDGGACRGAPSRCAATQNSSAQGCVLVGERIVLPQGRVLGVPTDWDDTSSREPPAELAAFAIDRGEVVEQSYAECVAGGGCEVAPMRGEPGLPQTNVTAKQAVSYCGWRGGALPSAAQFAYAAMGRQGRRYPWGDAGAVCRRVAYGLATGPCGQGATGPQLAGSHPSGATPEGILDLAGNVEEWVTSPGGFEARGGSWAEASVTALRSFSARAMPSDGRSPALGFRCVYAASGQ